MIGTNNIPVDLPEDIASGITKIIHLIQKKTPETKVLLMGILPRGNAANVYREKIHQVNSIIRKLEDKKNVFYLDIGHGFLQADGSMNSELSHDSLHLSSKGYELWADSIHSILAELMK